MNWYKLSIESRLFLVVFAVLFGLLAALLKGYGYGMSDQEVHVPEILRILDSGYLVNDFSINSASNFGPRFYYSHAVAFVARYVPLEAVFAVLFLVQATAGAAVTALAARDITGSAVAGMAAVVLVMSLVPFYFGDIASIYWVTVIPSFLALPFSMLAIWMGIRGKPVYAAAVSAPAILIHPMAGIEGAMIALAAATARWLFLIRVRRGQARDLTRLFRPILLASLIVAGETILFWILPSIRTGAILSLETEEFVQIIAHFRHSGNLVPSTWPIVNYLMAGMFAFVVLVAFVEFWKQDSRTVEPCEHRARKVAIGSVFVVILAAFIMGYVFVEVIPTRVVAQAYVFRMVTVFVWLGWILVAQSISVSLTRERWSHAIPFMASALSPVTLSMYKLSSLVGQMLRISRTVRLGPLTTTLVVMLIVAAAVLITGVLNRVPIATPVLMVPGFALVIVTVRRPGLGAVAAPVLAGLIALTVLVSALDRSGVLPEVKFPEGSPLPDRFENISIVGWVQPILSVEEAMKSPRCGCDDLVKLARAAKMETDPESVVLIPSNWRPWRMFSERAVVVDGKFMPFRDEGMAEWYERHLAIYNDEVGAGYPENVTESELFELWERYQFDYAVLPVDSRIELPALEVAEKWKLVRVN